MTKLRKALGVFTIVAALAIGVGVGAINTHAAKGQTGPVTAVYNRFYGLFLDNPLGTGSGGTGQTALPVPQPTMSAGVAAYTFPVPYPSGQPPTCTYGVLGVPPSPYPATYETVTNTSVTVTSTTNTDVRKVHIICSNASPAP